MRLNERDSQLAIAAVQLLEREIAERLEEHPESRGFDQHVSDEDKRTFDEHDRITPLVRKLSTGGEHELFDWEVEIVRESLQRYRSALGDSSTPLIADENSRYIETTEQRQREDELAAKLLDRLD